MYRWILSLLALLGYTGMAAQAQQIPQSTQTTLNHAASVDTQHVDVIGDGTTQP